LSKKSQPKPPAAPDPRQIAQTDAEFNRIDQYTPFGSLTYGGPSRNQATLSLSPELQNIFNMQTQSDTNLLGSAIKAQGGIDQLIGSPLNAEGLPQLQSPDLSGLSQLPQNFEPYRAASERAFFDRSAGLLNEQFGKDEERLRQTLANQGLQSGGQGFDSEFGEFNRRRGDTYANLANDAVLYGGEEASRSLAEQMGLRQQGFGEAQQGLQNNASIRAQLLGERGSLRGNQFNELASLLGLQQVQSPGMSDFFGPGQTNVTDAYGLNQSSVQNSFNQRSASARAAKGEFSDLLQTAIQSGGGGGKKGG
jgi:hypothetical protein